MADPGAWQTDGGACLADGEVDLARDRDLVERCQGGDRAAFEELYRRYRRRLFKFCIRRLRAEHDAEDATQETFARAWRALPRLAGERRFYPWLTVIAANVCTDILRRESRSTPFAQVPLLGPPLEAADAAIIQEVDEAMATAALSHLSARHQRVLGMKETSGWSTRDIAEIEGVAVPAMETLLWRARQALRREFAALVDTGSRLGVALGFGGAALRRFFGRSVTWGTDQLPLFQSVRANGTVISSLVLASGAVVGTAVLVSGGAPMHPDAALPHTTLGAPPAVIGAEPVSTTALAPQSAPPSTSAQEPDSTGAHHLATSSAVSSALADADDAVSGLSPDHAPNAASGLASVVNQALSIAGTFEHRIGDTLTSAPAIVRNSVMRALPELGTNR